jgi:hypothetical protein
METSDKELFESAIAPDAPAETPETTEQPASTTEQPRDEQGRFASKAETPETPATQEQTPPAAETPAQAPPAQQQQEANVPSWRLREEREAREAAERRASDIHRQFLEVQARLPQQQPQQRPDLYENPDAFVEHGVRQQVDPVRAQFGELKEYYSRQFAVQKHGQEKVDAAFNAVEQGLAKRDPETIATYMRVMQSMDPYGEIVQWHQQRTVYSQIGNDPNAWLEKQLQERLKDPTFQAKMLQQIQASQQSPNGSQRQPNNLVQLPPSLNKVPSAAAAGDDPSDASDAALFRYAAR